MSYKLKYTGEQIDNILDRAVEGGTIDDALALKAPLESPALTGTPTAPTQAEGDDSTKVATTAYTDRAADAAEAAAKEYTDRAASALYITDTASGSIASFSDGADGVSMRSVKVAITPVQSGSGDPSPDNVRPISGWTGAEPVRTGKNLLPNNHAVGTVTSKGVTLTTNADGTVTASGTATGDVTLFLVGNGWSYASAVKNLLPAGDYLLSGGFSQRQRVEITCYKPDGAEYISGTYAGATARAFTIESDAATDLGYLVYIRIQSGETANFTFAPMTRLASDADATYEPYAGQTYPISWQTQAGEVFGGYFVVNEDGSVDLTATNASYAITASTTLSNFAISAEYGSRAILSPNNMELVTSDTRIYVKSETAKGVSYENRVAQPDIWRVYGERSQRQIVLRAAASANIQNVDALLAPFVGTKLCYDLATPQTYHLDSIGQITSLLGQNNVWSNTGDVEVTYVADPKLYIAKMLGGGALTLGSASPLSLNRPVTINKEDLEQAGEVSEAVEAAAETVLPAESGETEEGAHE